MSRHRRIPGTFLGTPAVTYSPEEGQHIVRPSVSAVKPACKQCKAGTGLKRVISSITGRPFGEKDGTDRVVRFMGGWACLDHFKIKSSKAKALDDLTGYEQYWTLQEKFPNRAARRRQGYLHGV